ncbi:MAG: thiamine pyrophosphate-dependent enzyme [Candidatus Thioglobus sp.]|jgi:pyruvate/2-oxoacid:ferredoxin oxidoreductase beta subunit/Pyruvate/2-oxoacid:ferredoxin oxidoreductase gamma subunit|nr:thiamine pyrophosphate-dependent enzyme [Candidatus Thioglobus sp.]
MSAAIDTYLTNEIGPLPFCPGCGHDPLLKALDKALVKLQPDPAKTVIVTDIGCIGLSDRYFTTHGFHGLHGRSITYACGLKLARPELTVIVLKGDGGCGIGGTHLLNVARRNIDITLLVANNFNYGMTGGQHSVSTPLGGITPTTPMGNLEGVMDLCGTAIAAGAGWAYRGTTFDKDLPDRIAEAITQAGFSMLDIWEMCTAYYMPLNKLKKKDLVDIMGQNNLKYGLVANNPRPEYGSQYRTTYMDTATPERKPQTIETKFGNNVTRQIGIVIAGSAGQKVRSAAGLLAQSSMYSGLSATQKDDYPITVMTGHSVSEVIVSPERINYTAIDTVDYFVLVSEDGLKKTKSRIEKLPSTCTLYAEKSLELPHTDAEIIRLPLIATAKKVNRLSIGILALAALVKDSDIINLDAFAEAITAFQKPAIAEISLRALEAGSALIQDRQEVEPIIVSS